MSAPSSDDGELRDDALVRWIPMVPVMGGLVLGIVFLVWATVL